MKKNWVCIVNAKNSKLSCWYAGIVEAKRNNERKQREWARGKGRMIIS